MPSLKLVLSKQVITEDTYVSLKSVLSKQGITEDTYVS